MTVKIDLVKMQQAHSTPDGELISLQIEPKVKGERQDSDIDLLNQIKAGNMYDLKTLLYFHFIEHKQC